MLARNLQYAYRDFAKELLTLCGGNSKLADVPIQFNDPIYGSAEPSFTDFVAPGVILTWVSILVYHKSFYLQTNVPFIIGFQHRVLLSCGVNLVSFDHRTNGRSTWQKLGRWCDSCWNSLLSRDYTIRGDVRSDGACSCIYDHRFWCRVQRWHRLGHCAYDTSGSLRHVFRLVFTSLEIQQINCSLTRFFF